MWLEESSHLCPPRDGYVPTPQPMNILPHIAKWLKGELSLKIELSCYSDNLETGGDYPRLSNLIT